MLFPGHVYLVSDGVYKGTEVVLLDLDGTDDNIVASVRDVISGTILYITNLDYLIELEPIKKLYCVTAEGIQYTENYGKTYAVYIGPDQYDFIERISELGFRNSEYFNIHNIADFGGDKVNG